MTRQLLLGMLLAVASILGFGRSGFAQPDNFVVYATKTTPFLNPWEVTLKGQFDEAPVDASLVHLSGFANTVSVDGSSIFSERGHFHVYRLQQRREPQRQVNMTNDIGSQTLALGQPESLMVPTRATLAPKDASVRQAREVQPLRQQRATHYKCYKVLKARPSSKSVTLSDPFAGESWRAKVGRPLYFCVPVEKQRDGKVDAIGDRQTHFTIYELNEHILANPSNVRWNDQFFQGTFTMSTSYLLCAPSKKVKWRELAH